MSHALKLNSSSTTSSESVDDVPLLLAHFQRMGVQRLIDSHFPAVAGGVSFGWLTILWLSHMLSQSGRQVPHLRTWAASHPELLNWVVPQPIRPTDLSDGRLRDLLRMFDDDTRWLGFETALNQQIARTYRIEPERVRLTHASGLWYITAEGLLQFDQSRRWWPGALQVHITLSTLDPLGLPAMVWLSPTESPDDLWLDAIRQTRAALPDRQLIFIGSSELSAVQVRASIQQTADAYLCMLSHNEAVAELQHAIVAQPELFADRLAHNMYERSVVVQAELLDGMLEWTERRLLIRSHRQAADQESELLARLGRAQRELLDLNERKRGKRRPQSLQAMREAAATILDEHGVTGLVALRFDEAVDERTVRRYRGRPTTTRVARLVTVSSSIDEAALAAVREQLGWQVYVTTMSAEALPIEQAARTHGEAAQAFERMRGRPLSLPPGLLQRGDHMRGLVRMLAIGLRAMALLDATARTRVADMPGLVWQRTGAMNQPTTPVGERLLEAFREITLTAFSDGQEYHYHLTALSAVQRRVLELLMLSSETYHRPG